MNNNILKEIFLTNQEEAIQHKQILLDLKDNCSQEFKMLKKSFYLHLLLFTVNIMLACYGLVDKNYILLIINIISIISSTMCLNRIFNCIKCNAVIQAELDMILKIINCCENDAGLVLEVNK